MVVAVVVLGREIITFGFSLASQQRGILETLVHVMGNRTQVVEEFRIHGPATITIPDIGTDQRFAQFGNGVAQQKCLSLKLAKAQSLVPLAVFIGGFCCAGEPAFVDATPFGTQRVIIVRVQSQPASRMQKTARDPRRCQPQQSGATIQRGIQDSGHVVRRHNI